MNVEALKEKIAEIAQSSVPCGVEIFVCVKDDDQCFHVEKMVSMNFLKDRVRAIVLEILVEVYLNKDMEYYDITDIIDNKKAIYILEQTDEYKPFDFVNDSLDSIPSFEEKSIDKVLGFLFRMNINSKKLFMYQQAYVGSKLQTKNVLRIIQKDDVFKIVNKEMLKIDNRGELVILNNIILVKNIKVLQDFFGFQAFVRKQAMCVISRLEELNILGNIEKLKEYQNGDKLTISKKLMKIRKSPVLEMEKEVLINKIPTISRYKDIIHIENGKIRTNTKKDVDNLMKLLNDDYVRSELTEQEYDSTSKVLLVNEQEQ